MAENGQVVPGREFIMLEPINTSGRGASSSVGLLTSADAARWDHFVLEHSEGTFFHLSGWQKVISGFLGHSSYFLMSEQDGLVKGVLPLARVKSWLFGDALISLPFLVYGGPLGRDRNAVDELVRAATELAEELGVDYLELRGRKPITDWPSKDSYVTFRKPIVKSVEENLLAIPRKQRAVVRKAIKAGLVADSGRDVGDLYQVLSECKRNLGTPFFSKSYLEAVSDVFGEYCEVLTVSHNDELISGVMSFSFRDEILPYYGGGGMKARNLGANDFMYWKVMEKACLDGKRVFDYGRSQKGTGAYKFKKYWGFEPETLSYEYYLVNAKEVPRLDPSNRRYQQAIRMWSRMPLSVSRVLGPPIARLLG